MKVLLPVFAAATAAILAGADSAQSSAPGTKSLPSAPRHATIDVATGELTRDTDDKASDLVIVWANTDWSGRGATPSSVAPEEWLDWGSLTTTSGSDIVGSFQFGYWTTALGTTTGGAADELRLLLAVPLDGGRQYRDPRLVHVVLRHRRQRERFCRELVSGTWQHLRRFGRRRRRTGRCVPAAYSAPLTLTTRWGELLVDVTDPGG